MTTKCLVICLCLSMCGCMFDWFGKSNTPITQQQSNLPKQTNSEESSAFGDVVPCVSDDQCEAGLICYKDKSQENSDTGKCGYMDLKLKEYKP